METSVEPRVIVVGGGYAGVHAARAAQCAGVAVTVIDPTGDYDFVPRLAAVAGGVAPISDASAPLTDFVDEVVVGRATGVSDGVVRLADGTALEGDAVVVTAGAQPIEPELDGLDHAFPLRTSVDATALRGAIDGAESLVIVGGGATGVQLAGAASQAHPGLDVHVVEMAGRLLDGMSSALARNAARILREQGVTVHLDNGVDHLDADGAVLADGTRLDGVVAWAAGFAAGADEFGVPTDDNGRVLVDAELRVVGFERTFAAGDIARHPNGDDVHPMSAQIAVQAGGHAGRNAARLVRGERLRPVRLDHRGWVLDLGGWRGVAQLGPIPLADPWIDRVASFLHLAIDLEHLWEIGGPDAIRKYRPGAARPS